MAMSRKQAATAWCCLAVMAAMLIYPPWLKGRHHPYGPYVAASQRGAGYAWIWSPPRAPEGVASAGDSWKPVIYWDKLLMQWLFVGVGMVVLLFLREARERADGVDQASRSPSNSHDAPGCQERDG